MSFRCAVCDHLEGHYSSTTPFINQKVHSRIRFRQRFNEYQCDECFNSICDVMPMDLGLEEGEIENVDELNDLEFDTVAPTMPVRPVE